jgi:hypothetical protein
MKSIAAARLMPTIAKLFEYPSGIAHASNETTEILLMQSGLLKRLDI